MRNFIYRTMPVLLFMAFIHWGYAESPVQDTVHMTVSIILKFNGKNGIPGQMELFSQNTFKEKTNFLQRGQAIWTEPYRLKFFNDAGELLYSEEIPNPLKDVVEKYNPEGTLERKEKVKETGYVNFRFEINEKVKKINAVCSRINGEEEIAVTSLNINIE